jgi:hypothetical protein
MCLVKALGVQRSIADKKWDRLEGEVFDGGQ